MAEMGLGYGSEYHLLRYLGHHRNELNNIIRTNTRLSGDFFWLDFPQNLSRLSLDGEYTGLKFLDDPLCKDVFSDNDIHSLKQGWESYWPTRGSQQNLDGIFICKHNDQIELVIVEAKARLGEIKSDTKSSSNEVIKVAFQRTQKNLNLSNANWFKKYYQLSNRLALINYLNSNSKVNLKASLLYIYFINGYEKRELKDRKVSLVHNKSVKSRKEWDDAIKIQYENLGVENITEQLVSKVFIDCKALPRFGIFK